MLPRWIMPGCVPFLLYALFFRYYYCESYAFLCPDDRTNARKARITLDNLESNSVTIVYQNFLPDISALIVSYNVAVTIVRNHFDSP